VKFRHALTMQTSSDRTMTAAVPSRLPAPWMPSKSIGVSRWSAVSIGVEDPPGVQALKIFGPGDLSLPMDRNQSTPLRTIQGTVAIVSTLLTVVGARYRPSTAGKGGRSLGCPRCPSSEDSRAVSSPQM
jgi:hypothetical protein